MRTTITLDKDVAAAVERLRRNEGIGPSEAVNRLVRLGLVAKQPPKRFRQRSADLGPFLIGVDNVAEAIELAEGPRHR